MAKRVVWMNGEFIPESEAKISIYDSALMFGDMVFEMTRSFNKVQFKLREHLERLYAGLKILQVPLTMTIDEMEAVCHQVVEANDPAFQADDEHRLMIDVSRGALGIYHGIEGIRKAPNIIIADFPLRWTVQSMGHLFDQGINAVITSQRAIPAHLLDPKIKNRSRIHYLMANIEASNWAGDDNWALLLDVDGNVAEGTGDNFFIVKNNVIITPEGRHILRGISRDYIFEIAKQLDLEVVERNFGTYDVYNADEAFMTGTPFCMLPVTKLNNVAIGNGQVGKVFNALLAQWSKNVGVDIKGQIQRWNEEQGSLSQGVVTPYRFKSK